MIAGDASIECGLSAEHLLSMPRRTRLRFGLCGGTELQPPLYIRVLALTN